jgi:nitrite reductase/ring-hydroxylating ferredoxin subunit
MSTFVKVAKTHDLAEGGMVAVLVGDTEILLAQVQGQYYAMSNVCSHADGRLQPESACGQRGDTPVYIESWWRWSTVRMSSRSVGG